MRLRLLAYQTAEGRRLAVTDYNGNLIEGITNIQIEYDNDRSMSIVTLRLIGMEFDQIDNDSALERVRERYDSLLLPGGSSVRRWALLPTRSHEESREVSREAFDGLLTSNDQVESDPLQIVNNKRVRKRRRVRS